MTAQDTTDTGHSASARPRIGVLGGGTAALTFAGNVSGQADVVVFEPGLVGGECPFVACMPSKAMLHDARTDTSWDDAIERRRRITSELDDADHAAELRSSGAELVRAEATIVDEHTVRADGVDHRFDHVILATGSQPIVPDLDGPPECLDAVWTSDDVYTAVERPERVAIVGGGAIGLELADLYARFGTEVTVIEREQRPLTDLPPAVTTVVVDALTQAGARVRCGVQATALEPARHDQPGVVRVCLSDGTAVEVDRVIVAIGRRPQLGRIGLDSLGLDPDEPLPLELDGRVRCPGSVWAIGDVAGRGQYTHVANHQAEVVADQLTGTATRRFDEVTVSSCTFTTPPLMRSGEQWSDVVGDPDVVCAGIDVGASPRATTDELGPGHLWVAARHSTGTVVGAAGAGPAFDELVHALVVAIDGRVPVARLQRSVQPFPTIGEILGPVWSDLHRQLGGR